MTPVNFPQSNTTFRPPAGVTEAQCHPIRAYVGTAQSGSLDGVEVTVTAWQMTLQERAALLGGQPLFLTFVGGLPPHMPSISFEAATNPG